MASLQGLSLHCHFLLGALLSTGAEPPAVLPGCHVDLASAKEEAVSHPLPARGEADLFPSSAE